MVKYWLTAVLTLGMLRCVAQVSQEVANIPANWTRLTASKSEYTVYNTCDGGNLKISVYKDDKGWHLLCHGQQEDYLYRITRTVNERNQILFDCVSEDGSSKQQFRFQWTDKHKGLAQWEGLGWNWKQTFVSLSHEIDFRHEVQPCQECWDAEDCAGMDGYYDPIDAIRAIFANYLYYGESTDSDDHKHAMTKSMEKLDGKKLTADDLQLLINVWMYYDPTDFPDATKQSKVLLKANKPESIAAVKYRIANKRDRENEGSAPYSDLPALLREIESN